MTPTTLVLAAALSWAGPADRAGGKVRLLQFRGDNASGLLLNCSPGARPCDPADPSRPTVVFVHGTNPAPHAVRYPMAEKLGEAYARRPGAPAVNILGWNWNGDTIVSLHVRANHEHAVEHGRKLAGALLAAGIFPERTHLIGQSAGAIVVASAASALAASTGRPVGQVTLIDPATFYHELVFRRLAVGSTSPRVEHHWAPGASGFSRPVNLAGVTEYRADTSATDGQGLTRPLHSAHLNLVRWYIATAADPRLPGGFNTSFVVLGGG